VALLGIVLAGPLVCATSQAVNDWFDRHVDAVNEPHRPIPSGRIPGTWGLRIAIAWTGLSLAVAAVLGPVVLAAAVVGLALAWAYSAPPLRLKQNGWWGNLACGLCYEGLAWITGAAVMLDGAVPGWPILTVALLYSLGAHGIMTLNDFKSIEGDRRFGVGSLPVQLGPERAAHVACWVMALPQVVVVALLLAWAQPVHAGLVAAALACQVALMVRLLQDPRAMAPWYNGTGVLLYVLGMLVTAFALSAGGAPPLRP
jgi:chlorophyll synthase